jgi:hypothetical protein
MGVWWVRYACLITFGANIDNPVPSGPALAALLLLIGLDRLLAWACRRRIISGAEIAVAYTIALVGIVFSSLGVVRYLLPSLTVPRYFADPSNEFEAIAKLIPSWVAPSSAEATRTYFEGASGAGVPWADWAHPLLAWTGFLGCFYLALLAIALLLHRQWTEHDRLTYPLVSFGIELIGRERLAFALPLLRDPLMWIGFGLAALYNGLNIAHALNPSVPALGEGYPVGSLFTERPWSALSPVYAYYRPEFVGFGYLVPQGILASTWVFYLAASFALVLGSAFGQESGSFEFMMPQSVGAYLAMAVALLWAARHSLADAAGRLRSAEATGVAPATRATYLVLALALAGMLTWMIAAGMNWVMAASYTAVLLGIAITQARVRGETGVPSNWVFPFGEARRMLVSLTGSEFWAPRRDFRSLAILAVTGCLSRGYFPALMAFQIEGLELGKRLQARRGEMVSALLVAFALGLSFAFVMHLQAFYEHGANVLEGGTVAGGYRTQDAKEHFDELSALFTRQAPPDNRYRALVVTGGVLATSLVGLRHRLLTFPLHPLGYAMATNYGYCLWSSFLLVWMAKTAIVWLGGAGLYRRMAPLFLGIAFGHLFVAGLLWAAFGTLLPGEAYRKMHIDIG